MSKSDKWDENENAIKEAVKNSPEMVKEVKEMINQAGGLLAARNSSVHVSFECTVDEAVEVFLLLQRLRATLPEQK